MHDTVEDRLSAAVVWTEKNCPQKQWTLAEIAKVTGVTRERIRQIEFEALRKVRRRFTQILKQDGIDPKTI
jgi:DNA-directed RNA polymerase sigma subunit (sigma70/sigma32)